MKRCSWVNPDKPHYVLYHDVEWGVPVHEDIKLFEMLILEGAQAGLSWETILKRRDHYRLVFKNFDPIKVARLNDVQLEKILLDPGVIRNRLKIFSTRSNAKVFLAIQQEFGSFDHYVWGFVNHKTIFRNFKTTNDILTTSTESDLLSKDLKKRGMKFVGSTIMYAFMQAVGMVDDHSKDCFKSKL